MKLRLVLGVCPKEAGRKEEGAANQLRCDRLGVLGKLGSRYIIHLQRVRQTEREKDKGSKGEREGERFNKGVSLSLNPICG